MNDRELRYRRSIGTGVPSVEAYGDKMWEIGQTLRRIAMETEETAELFHRGHKELVESNQCLHLSVRHGFQDIGWRTRRKRILLSQEPDTIGKSGHAEENATLWEDLVQRECASLHA